MVAFIYSSKDPVYSRIAATIYIPKFPIIFIKERITDHVSVCSRIHYCEGSTPVGLKPRLIY